MQFYSNPLHFGKSFKEVIKSCCGAPRYKGDPMFRSTRKGGITHYFRYYQVDTSTYIYDTAVASHLASVTIFNHHEEEFGGCLLVIINQNPKMMGVISNLLFREKN